MKQSDLGKSLDPIAETFSTQGALLMSTTLAANWSLGSFSTTAANLPPVSTTSVVTSFLRFSSITSDIGGQLVAGVNQPVVINDNNIRLLQIDRTKSVYNC
jgi:hypothetical protein